jgi:hypothetical protein
MIQFPNKTIIWQTRWNCVKILLANKEFSYLLKYQVPVDSEGFKIMRHLRDNAEERKMQFCDIPSRESNKSNQLTTMKERILKLWDIWIHLAIKEFYNLFKYLLTQEDWKLWDISVITQHAVLWRKYLNYEKPALRNLKLWDILMPSEI